MAEKIFIPTKPTHHLLRAEDLKRELVVLGKLIQSDLAKKNHYETFDPPFVFDVTSFCDRAIEAYMDLLRQEGWTATKDFRRNASTFAVEAVFITLH